MFTESFDKYACTNDTISTEVDGVTYTARIEFDHGLGIDDDDFHNVDQSVTGCNDEQQSRLLAARSAWFNDEWFYCGIIIEARVENLLLDNSVSLWGIECNYPGSDNTHLTEVANELLPEAIKTAQRAIVGIKNKLSKIKA